MAVNMHKAERRKAPRMRPLIAKKCNVKKELHLVGHTEDDGMFSKTMACCRNSKERQFCTPPPEIIWKDNATACASPLSFLGKLQLAG